MKDNKSNPFTNSIKEQQLQILLNQFELISKNTLLQLSIVKKLFDNPDLDVLFEEAQSNEIIIDRLELKMREEVAFAIFKFSPVAEDLRRIIAYQDLTTNLERIGDMAMNIMLYLREIDFNRPDLHELKQLCFEMLDSVIQMIRNGILSFTNESIETAYGVLNSDNLVDDQYYAVKNMLCNLYSDRDLRTEDVKELIGIECIAHNLERCGDNATNIAESTIYLIKGRDVRHAKPDSNE
ncbi:PhoU domain-containing protein [Porphyromonadaceae bacterium W3.11]|nr:PhoU domain-containing protein [Porphyromonadaceae bacterium W3.11]